MRALEARLLDAQDGSAALASQLQRSERRAAAYREELHSLQQMHDQLQTEHTAACGQLTAAQQGAEAALDRVQRLAAALAAAEAGRAHAEAELGRYRQGADGQAEALLKDLLVQRLRSDGSRTAPHTARTEPAAGGGGERRGGVAAIAAASEPLPGEGEGEGEEAGARPLEAGQGADDPGDEQAFAAAAALPPPRGLPPVATQLPPRLLAGGGWAPASADATPLSEASGASAWSDSAAELAPATAQKKRGALHKLSKLLRGGGSKARAARRAEREAEHARSRLADGRPATAPHEAVAPPSAWASPAEASPLAASPGATLLRQQQQELEAAAAALRAQEAALARQEAELLRQEAALARSQAAERQRALLAAAFAPDHELGGPAAEGGGGQEDDVAAWAYMQRRERQEQQLVLEQGGCAGWESDEGDGPTVRMATLCCTV